MSGLPHVIVVGAGFGGLWTARALAGKPVRVTLLDKDNYHAFWPLLYQVAAAELEVEQIAYPVRRILRPKKNVYFVMGEVREVDFEQRLLHTRRLALHYDYLVLAPGSTSSYFDIEGAKTHTYPLKTMEEGLALRNQLLRCFELAAQEEDEARRQQLLTFVIVGGGPTGVEYAGALSELIYGPIRKDYRGMSIENVRVVLVEMKERLLPKMPEKLGSYARKRLEARLVQVQLGTSVAEVSDGDVTFEDGSCLETETVVWTAGVRGSPLLEASGLPTNRGGRVKVQLTLQAPDQPRVYVVGDAAAFEGRDGEPLPMLAPVAMQQGEHAARNILRQIAGEAPRPFSYRDRGTMATIGRTAAVAHLFGRAFTGFGAWLIWLGVHLTQLIGFRNRLVVLINWAWSYLFFERMVRLILPQGTELVAADKGKSLDE
ncbi:MAG TPA: NAD(P)/FAD-dependent oxidoreductase [Candidatus Binatia bacterium]|nr:NAD(P)/FAD-dependent oxidoreductase [Candidatus Binatia bacterium]